MLPISKWSVIDFHLDHGSKFTSFTGFFNAYGVAAHNTTADLFIHLGDYIYETLVGDGPGWVVLFASVMIVLPHFDVT
ncbi:hypothetical protein PTI98_003274 [Pleurotus ostreatus]|nr:hypothetical protein PTI98_003274 [Pleurotus ostreatus]